MIDSTPGGERGVDEDERSREGVSVLLNQWVNEINICIQSLKQVFPTRQLNVCSYRIQSFWRMYVAKKWYTRYRQRVPPSDPRLRERHFEKKVPHTHAHSHSHTHTHTLTVTCTITTLRLFPHCATCTFGC